jgi:hypothetical protein
VKQALVGVVLVGFGVKMLVDTRRFLATAEPAGGVVVRVDERVTRERVGSGENEHWADVTRRYPFVEFRSARGQVAQFQPTTARSRSAIRSGLSTTRPTRGMRDWTSGATAGPGRSRSGVPASGCSS